MILNPRTHTPHFATQEQARQRAKLKRVARQQAELQRLRQESGDASAGARVGAEDGDAAAKERRRAEIQRRAELAATEEDGSCGPLMLRGEWCGGVVG